MLWVIYYYLLFRSLRKDFGRGLGGMVRFLDYVCFVMYFFGFWLFIEVLGI